MMTSILEKFVAAVSFLLVFTLHVYFALLVGMKPALAADSETSSVGLTVVPSDTKVDKNKVKKALAAQEKKDEESPSESEDDQGLNIKINATDGISIQGSQKLLEKLKKMEEKIEAKVESKMDELEDSNDDNGNHDLPMSSMGMTLVSVLVPISLFLCAFGFAAFVVYSKQKTRREYLETIRTLASSGQAIPSELLSHIHSNGAGSNSPIGNMNYSDPSAIHGFKYLFIGLGVAGFFFLADEASFLVAVGYVFLVIGGFHLLKSHLLQKQVSAQTPATETVSATSTTNDSTTTLK